MIDAVEREGAQARAAVEIDGVGAARGADGDEEVALGVAGDAGDGFGEIVELRLAAVDEREDVDAVRVLLRDHPDDAFAAADGGDRDGAREAEAALRDAVGGIPLLDRAGDRDDELVAGGAGDGRLGAGGELVGRQVRLAAGQDDGALRTDDEGVRADGTEQGERGRELDLGDRFGAVRIEEMDGGVGFEAREDEEARRSAEPRELVLGVPGEADLGDDLARRELDDDDPLGFGDRGERAIGRDDEPGANSGRVRHRARRYRSQASSAQPMRR